MKRVLLGVALTTAAMMMFAAPAFAQPTTGYLEICKYSTTLSGTASFTFTIDGSTTVTVPNNSCSKPFTVAAGTVTVQETSGSFYTVSSITTDPGSALICSNPSGSGGPCSGSPPNGYSQVTVSASTDPSTATTVNYTNTVVNGYVEVCKYNEPDAGLTGSWTFGIKGNNGFSTTVTVPVGDCSFPVLVPAGSVTVTETPGVPTSVSDITVQNGDPSTTSPSTGIATVTVKAEPAPGDESQEAIVSFYNETVQLKICKIASDPGVTAPYTFTAVGTGDPTFPNGITETVTVLPGQCQLVPGPYTNPNGTTGWRAGTQVAVSEGAVAGTAVTAITVTPSGRAVPNTTVLSPLPSPSLPGPAGSQSVILGSGETDVSFTNDTEPGGTLKICETPAGGLATGSVFTFKITSPTAATATVPAGSCVIVPDPATSDGLWPYNSVVSITQNTPAGMPLSGPITVSPSASLLSQSGSTVNVAIGSGDVTVVNYTNDPSNQTTSLGGGSLGGASAGGGSSASSAAGSPAGGSSNAGSALQSYTLLRSVRMMKRSGRHYLVVRVASSHKTARIQIIELNKLGKRVRAFVRTVDTNRAETLAIPFSSRVRIVYARLV
jgi:hypothetical protein